MKYTFYAQYVSFEISAVYEIMLQCTQHLVITWSLSKDWKVLVL